MKSQRRAKQARFFAFETNTQTDMLLVDQERHLRSKIRWFTEFCNSHYLLQLAAFFVDAWAWRSTVKSCLLIFNIPTKSKQQKQYVQEIRKQKQMGGRAMHKTSTHLTKARLRPPRSRTGSQSKQRGNSRTSFCMKIGDDPSAGSPTETLLRLLLPLNDQVWPTSWPPSESRESDSANPEASLNHSIGSSNGRCVPRAGT